MMSPDIRNVGALGSAWKASWKPNSSSTQLKHNQRHDQAIRCLSPYVLSGFNPVLQPVFNPETLNIPNTLIYINPKPLSLKP